jgi:hypothetical protein
MASDMDDDERTGALGLFNTAQSYWRSAEYLNAANLKVTHPRAPVTFLFYHAIELYLKAFLRDKGLTLAELKRLSHRIATLAQVASEKGLSLSPEPLGILSHIAESDMPNEARYIVTGFKDYASNEALSQVSTHLDEVVGAGWQKLGCRFAAKNLSVPSHRKRTH